MPAPAARDLLSGLQSTLKKCGVNYEQTIRDLGQVAAAEERRAGRHFALSDHLRGLLLSQLSNLRPWKQIADNLQQISRVFFDYDPNALLQADPIDLTTQIKKIRCGNLSIAKQMGALRANIATLQRIDKDRGSLDKFVTSHDPCEVAIQMSKPGPYKLQYVGMALALEYLRNVGICAAKPDRHVCRILGGRRLSYFSGEPSEQDAAKKVAQLASELDCCTTYLDNVIWIFCAAGYGEVCGDNPRCHICDLRDSCRYPTLSTIA